MEGKVDFKARRPKDIIITDENGKVTRFQHIGNPTAIFLAGIARNNLDSFRDSLKSTLLMAPETENILRCVLEINNDIVGLDLLERAKKEIAAMPRSNTLQ